MSEQVVEDGETSRSWSTRRLAPGDVVAAASIVGVVVVGAVLGRGLWFFSDDWNILARYHRGNLLEPFNSHLSLLPAGIYDLLFHTVGLGSYWPYRVVGLVGIALLGVATHLYARPRIGAGTAALAASAVVWGSGGVTNLMFPFLVNFSLPIAALAAAWLCLDRRELRGDLGAAICVAAALATSGLGVLALGAVGVELVVRRAPWRTWLAIAAPGLLWAAWYLGHRADAPGDHGLRPVVSYTVRMLWGGTTALAAGWRPGGVLLGLAVVAYFGLAGRWGGIDARTLGALSALLLFAGLTAYTRLNVVPAIPPDEYRYRWTVAAYLVLAMVSAWRPEAGRWLLRPARLGAAVAAIALVIAGGALLVRDSARWADTVEAAAPGLRAELFAAEAVGSRGDPDHVLPLSYVPVTLGQYLDAVADVGSPLDGHDAGTFGGSRDHRRSADELLASSPGRTPRTGNDRCAPFHDGQAVAPGATIGLPADRAPAVQVRRFGDRWIGADWVVTVAGSPVVAVPADASPRDGAPPYRLRLVPPVPGAAVCR